MSTRHLVDPELVGLLDAFSCPDFAVTKIDRLRTDMMDSYNRSLENYMRPEVAVARKVVPGRDGMPPVTALLYRPTNVEGPLPVLLHIHGGGYVLGRAEVSGPSNVRTAAEVGCLVVSVDYRLAPETPAPGSLLDCYSVLRWLNEEAVSLNIDPARVAVGGESAGGGLAAALTLLARDDANFKICFQMLIYPMLDDRTAVTGDLNPHVGEFVWTRSANTFGWRSLIGGEPGAAGISAYTAPSRAVDLTRLPSAYISVGSLDLFLEEDIEYARRLMRAGVPVELHVFSGAYHGFELATGSTIAQAAEAERRTSLARALRLSV